MQRSNFSTVNNDGNAGHGRVIFIPCEKLKDHPLRLNNYDEVYVRELEISISHHGLFNPLLVRPASEGYFEVLSGHYRLRAVLRLGWQSCPATIIDCDDISAKALLLTSNSSQRHFTAIEEGLIIRNLHEHDGLELDGIGKLFNKSKSWVSRRLSLVLNLEESVQADVQRGLLKARTAQEIALLPRGNQKEFAQCVKENNLSKEDTAVLVQTLRNAGFGRDVFGDCISDPRTYLQSTKRNKPEKKATTTGNGPYSIDTVISAVIRTDFTLQRLIIFLDQKINGLSKEELSSFRNACAKLNLTIAEFSGKYMKLTFKRTS